MSESKRLSVPTNPARALRELSREQHSQGAAQDAAETEAPPPAGDNRLVNQQVNKLSEQQISQSDNQATNFSSNELTDGQDNKPDNELTSRSANQAPPLPASPPPDPLAAAYLQAISQPYPNMEKSARVLVAGRVRQEVNDRFEHVCTLLKKKGDKQDVLDKALRVFIEHVVERQGDVEL